ncbi:MAG: cytochrome P450 [Rhodobacteraceae bacterium]|nr:cytochrome P450 [Paracoccaceae bacterium]
MEIFRQDPTDPDFVQNPYPAYDRARAQAGVVWWEDYGMAAAVSHGAVSAVLKSRNMGRVPLEPVPVAPHTRAFYDIESHSMLELEPPRHTRLRSLVLRAFTGRRIRELEPEIRALSEELVAALPTGRAFNLLTEFAQPLPVRIIARLLGVPEEMAPELLAWSNRMVAMYQSARSREVEDTANQAASEFADFLRGYIEQRRSRPADDLITHLITAEEEGEKLSTDELISTCILLLNAGHEATVHTLGNGVAAMLSNGVTDVTEPLVEEIMRYDPPLHLFTRWVYEDTEIEGVPLPRGTQIACLLGAANRDPAAYDNPHVFDPSRGSKTHVAFGAGLHFCVGAPLARLELRIGLEELMRNPPKLAEAPRYGDTYHFHGLEALMVTR